VQRLRISRVIPPFLTLSSKVWCSIKHMDNFTFYFTQEEYFPESLLLELAAQTFRIQLVVKHRKKCTFILL